MERCVHYVAAHELRFAFPVDLISQGGKLHGNWVETLYPGVHSDVGGGYEPVDQGVSNNYARIPMRDMMSEAVLHGVRMLNYLQVRGTSAQIFKERFECLPATVAAYQQYMNAVPRGGTLRAQRLAHMRTLYSAYGTMYRHNVQTATERQLDDSFLKRMLGPKLQMAEEVEIQRLLDGDGRLRQSDAGNYIAQYIKAQPWQLRAWDTPASEGVWRFVHDFVHDSKVDFIANVEPFSYFRLRMMQESTRSVWNETGDWIEDKANKAANAADEAAQAAQHKARQAADWGAEKAQQTQDAATHVYESGKAKARAAEQWAERKARQAQDAASQAYEAGKSKATDAAHWAGDKARQAQAQGQSALREGRRIVESGAEWVEKQANETTKAAEDAVRRVRNALPW